MSKADYMQVKGMFPYNSRGNADNEKRAEYFEILLNGCIIKDTLNGKQLEERTGVLIQKSVDEVLKIAKEMSLTHLELSDFCELVKLTALDGRIK